MSIIDATPVIQLEPKIIRKGSVGRVSIELVDNENNPTDASALTLRVLDPSDNPFYTEDFFQTLIPPFFHRIIKVPSALGQYYIDFGDIAYAATVLGVGGIYPTGFLGGEQLGLQIDNVFQIVTFQVSDQSLAQVISRINLAFGPILGQPVAIASSGQLQIITKNKGPQAQIVFTAITSSSVYAALGITPATIVIGTQRQGETNCTKTWLFEWTAVDSVHPSEQRQVIQTIYVLPSVIYRMLPQLRLAIDKSVKLVDQASGLFLGYTEQQLFQFLLGGLQLINTAQPSIFFTVDNFPYDSFGSILVEAALYWGVISQSLFAIDTDVPSYSDQGQSFVINHQAPLAAYLNQLAARLDKNVPLFKLHFVNVGTVLTEMGPNFRLQTLLSAAPNGAVFRNTFVAG